MGQLDVMASLEFNFHAFIFSRQNIQKLLLSDIPPMPCRYYISQQLTDKSDVYSFGVILLELISGQEAISNESFGVNCRNIVQWVSFLKLF